MIFAYFNVYGEGRKNYSSGTNNYYLKDHLGSTRLVVDNVGDWEEATMYDSYGKMEQIAFGGGTVPVREKFTGKEFDEEGFVEGRTEGLGLYYFGRRYYDPEVAYWITPDPTNQFWSPYSYTGNGINPIIGIDPDGRDIQVAGRQVAGSKWGHLFILVYNRADNRPDIVIELIGSYIGGKKGAQVNVTTVKEASPDTREAIKLGRGEKGGMKDIINIQPSSKDIAIAFSKIPPLFISKIPLHSILLGLLK